MCINFFCLVIVSNVYCRSRIPLHELEAKLRMSVGVNKNCWHNFIFVICFVIIWHLSYCIIKSFGVWLHWERKTFLLIAIFLLLEIIHTLDRMYVCHIVIIYLSITLESCLMLLVMVDLKMSRNISRAEWILIGEIL